MALVRRSQILAVSAAFLLLILPAAAVETIQLPMEDGTKLTTDIHLPEGDGPFPVMLLRSTYGRNLAPKPMLELGYALVVQDVRGMGASEGEPYVFRYEGWLKGLSDGAFTVDWIHDQPWCNGKVGTFGGSALGITQALLAPATRGLDAQCIHAAPGNLYPFCVYQGGVFRQNMLEQWLTGIKQPHLIPIYRSHPRYDDFWRDYNADVRAPHITAPALFITGWYDIFQQGTIDAFLARQARGGEGARGKNMLIITQGAHGPDAEEEYAYKENRKDLNVPEAQAAFYGYHLQGEKDALDDWATVHYYVMGDDTAPDAPGNEWRTAATWPPFPTHDTPFFLGADGTLSTRMPKAEDESLTYTFDPKNPVPTCGGANLFLPMGPYNQRATREGRDDILFFQTAPLERPMEVIGRMRLKLHVSTDAPDTDFTAKIVDVYPGGTREILLTDGIQRVKARKSLSEPTPLLERTEEVVELEIDLWSTAWIFNTGHRIGLHVSSSNHPRFEVNPNTGADHPTEGGEMRTATNTVHLSKTHPSALMLPVRPAE